MSSIIIDEANDIIKFEKEFIQDIGNNIISQHEENKNIITYTIPENTIPENTILENTIPENTIPENIIPENTYNNLDIYFEKLINTMQKRDEELLKNTGIKDEIILNALNKVLDKMNSLVVGEQIINLRQQSYQYVEGAPPPPPGAPPPPPPPGEAPRALTKQQLADQAKQQLASNIILDLQQKLKEKQAAQEAEEEANKNRTPEEIEEIARKIEEQKEIIRIEKEKARKERENAIKNITLEEREEKARKLEEEKRLRIEKRKAKFGEIRV